MKQLSYYNCPASHLVVKAKDAISQYRRRGSSVDGKLDARSRNKHYHILSLEEPIVDDGRLREEAISDPQGPSRPTEEEACINILFASLRDGLSAEENQLLTLRLETPRHSARRSDGLAGKLSQWVCGVLNS